MRVQHIESLDMPGLEDFTSLTDVALRRKLEPAEGLYLAESPKVIERAIASGHRPRALLILDQWLSRIEPLVSSFQTCRCS